MEVIISIMLILGGLGIASWVILYKHCNTALLDVRSNSYETPVVKYIIKKYQDCKELNIEINNIYSFVGKSFESYGILGIKTRNIKLFAETVGYVIMMLASLSALFFYDEIYRVCIIISVGIIAYVFLNMAMLLTDYEDTERIVVISLSSYLVRSRESHKKGILTGEPRLMTIKAQKDFIKMNRHFNRICRNRAKCDGKV